jgi:hypothetical protein
LEHFGTLRFGLLNLIVSSGRFAIIRTLFKWDSHMPGRKPISSHGFNLISLMVALAILGIGASLFASMFSRHMKAEYSNQIRADFLDIRNYIANGVDCLESVIPRPTPCDNSFDTSIMLRDRNGKVFVDKNQGGNYTKIGAHYHVRAMCEPCADCPGSRIVTVQARRINKNKITGASEPLHGSKTAWENITDDIPLHCQIPE